MALCMTDDQGWADVSYNGLTQIKTPHLDEMAASGIRFNRFYAAAPVCSPTRGSFLTGRHPNRYGCFLYGYPLRTQEQTIAQLVKRAGYTTGHFGKWHLNGVKGPGKPILADDPLHPGVFGFDDWMSVSNFFEADWTFGDNGVPRQTKGDGSDVIVARALEFVDRALAADKPFLAIVWFGNPHRPHAPIPADKQAAGGSNYYGEIVGIDRAMGTLRRGLRGRGVADNTLVLFCSDNGGKLPEANNGVLRAGKGSVYEGGIRVPGIIEWPAKIRQPRVVDFPANTSDIYPTLAELLGIARTDQNEPLDGISLVPLLEGKVQQRGSPMGFWHYAGDPARFGLAVGNVAWVDDQYKLVREKSAAFELYDLTADPGETNDLAAQRPRIVQRMQRQLRAWQESVLRSYGDEDYRAAGSN
jgi:arylsulfatase A-like enzyme